MNIANFIVDNFILCLIVFAIIMIIIGYIADKTNFWHKKNTKVEMENDKNIDESVLTIEELKNKTLNDIVSNMSNQDKNNLPEINNDEKELLNSDLDNQLIEDLSVPFGDQYNFSSAEQQNNDILPFTNIPKIESLDNEEQKKVVEITDTLKKDIDTSNEFISDDLFKPIEEGSNINKDFEQGNYYEPIVPEFITEELTPGIEKSSVLNTNTTEYELDKQEKEEDIWKF